MILISKANFIFNTWRLKIRFMNKKYSQNLQEQNSKTNSNINFISTNID